MTLIRLYVEEAYQCESVLARQLDCTGNLTQHHAAAQGPAH